MNPLNFDQYYELMHRELTLQGKADRTIDSYMRTLRRVRERISAPLDQLQPEQLKEYFAELLKTHSWSTVKVDRCALVFFYEHVLERDWQWIKIVKVPRVQRIPDILSQDEVVLVLSQLQKPRYKTALLTIYSMGLRLSEALRIQVGDIDSTHMRVHIRNSKNRKDRLVPLPEITLQALRQFWAMHRNSHLIFPNALVGKERRSTVKTPMYKGGVQLAFKAALRDAKIHRPLSVHNLRHSYATHLVEIGVNLRVIQTILGHSTPATTAIYAKLSQPVMDNSEFKINQMMGKFKQIV